MSQTPDDRKLESYPQSHIDINVLQQQFHRDEIQAQEIFLRPRLPGQTTEDKIAPTRYHFQYVYTNIHNPELYDYVEHLEKWVKFNLKHQLYPDQSQPILDLQGEESTETEFSLTTLLVLNKDLINKKLKEVKKRHKQQSDSLKPGYAKKKKALSTHSDSQQPQTSSQTDDGTNFQSSGSSSDSFVIIDSKTKPTETLSPSSLDKETGTPIATGDNSKSISIPVSPYNPSRTSSVIDSFFDSDSDSDFDPTATMVDRKIAFFPPDKFDGQNKTLTKQHWQIFKDFCDQQKLNFEDIPATADADAIPAQTEKILGYFKLLFLV